MNNVRRNTFIVLDLHGEFRDILDFFSPDELIWMTPDDLMLNPFEIPVDSNGRRVMPPDKWIGNLREWLRLNWLNEPSLNLFTEVLTKIYKERGVFDGKDDFPSLSDIIEAIEKENPPRGSDKARAKGKVLDRLYTIRYMLPGLDVKRSRSVYQLFSSHSVILDLLETKDVSLPVLFNLLVMVITASFSREHGQTQRRLFVMEEPHLYLGGHVEKRMSDLKESAGTSVMRSLRKANFTGVIPNQLISDLAPAVLGNLSSIICMRLAQRACIARAASAMGLKRRQEQEIPRLSDQHAIVRFSRYPDPIYMEVKDISNLFAKMRRLSREEAKKRSKLILNSIPYVKRVEQTTKSDNKNEQENSADSLKGLHPDERKVFARIAELPWELISDRIDALGLDRDTESRIRRKLDVRGLITPPQRVGAKCRLTGLRKCGEQLASSLGLPVGETGKGGVVHKSTVYYTGRSLEKYFPEIRLMETGVSSTLSEVQPDLLAILPGGKRIPIQACHKNRPDYEAEAFLKLHQLAQADDSDANKVNFVIGVAVNKGHKAAIERAILRKNDGKMPGKLALLDFDTIVDSGFDWSRIFEDMD